jgi:glutathione-regulated potassium-efflux system ancillary protein KefG
VEQQRVLLLDHQVIVWQHPFYNYGPPAPLKQWIDMVLEYGWAHGKGGGNLTGKNVLQVLTAGGSRASYTSRSYGATVRELLATFERTSPL